MSKKCPKCDISHIKQGTFCSRKCANSRTFSIESITKKSNSAKKSQKVKLANDKQLSIKCLKNCIICNSEFKVVKSKASTTLCSNDCKYKLLSINNKGICGGYREGSGRAFSGYYKNIYCGSTYELVWVMYNLHHKISFNRFEGYIVYNDNKKYFPDFIIGNTIYEIKGFFTQTVEDKCNASIREGYEIKVLYKEDLKNMFDWFKTEYPNKQLKNMFD